MHWPLLAQAVPDVHAAPLRQVDFDRHPFPVIHWLLLAQVAPDVHVAPLGQVDFDRHPFPVGQLSVVGVLLDVIALAAALLVGTAADAVPSTIKIVIAKQSAAAIHSCLLDLIIILPP
jgi:hypothetical protein